MSIFCRFTCLLLGCGLAFECTSFARGSAFADAQVSKAVQQVTVQSTEDAKPATVAVDAAIPPLAALKTGASSEAEIRFAGQAVARLGDQTTVAADPKKAMLDLRSGAILVQVPKNERNAKIRVGSITATVAGTTVLIESYPDAYVKFIVLDGTGRLCLKKPGQISDCMLLRAGQMLIVDPAARRLPDAVDVDLDRLLKTCRLMTEFAPLPRQDLVDKSVGKQRTNKQHGTFADTNLVIFGRGTLVTVTEAKSGGNQKSAEDVAATATPSPAPDPASHSPP